jgi:phage gpG-like protein
MSVFKKVGDWVKANILMKKLPKHIFQASMVGLNAVGGWYAQEVQKGIISQAPGGKPFRPLSPMTIAARKRKRGKPSTKALIDTADLMNSMTHKMGKKSVFIGLLRTAMHKESGLPTANLGSVHEYGTANGRIPARPFIGPISRSKSLRRRAKKVFANAVRSQGVSA